MRPLSARLRVVVGVLLALALAAVPGVAAAEPPGRILFFEGGHVGVSVPTENSPGTFAMSGEGGLLQSYAEKLGILPILGDWTSDGSLLAYGSGNPPALRVVRADGTGRRKLAGGTRAHEAFDPEFSPAGDRIAYPADTEDTGLSLFVISAAGGGSRAIAQGLINPGWSPDGGRIVAVGQQSIPGPEGLWLVNVATGGTSLLVAQSNAIQIEPKWSPDGGLIAYTNAGAVWIVKPDGSGAQPLTAGLGARQVAWSPDSAAIAFRTFTSDTSGAIYTVGRDGTGLRTLYQGKEPFLEDWVTGALRALKPTRRAAVARLVKGVVKVKARGSCCFARLVRRASTRLLYRSQIDARNGRVRITARGRGRRTYKAIFSGGRFKLLRRGSRTIARVSTGKVRVRSGRRKASLRKGQSYVLGRTR